MNRSELTRDAAGPARLRHEAGPARLRHEAGPARLRHDANKPDLDDYTGRVLDVAESIPPGRVMSYGDVAEYLGEGGPRQVGRVMSLWGGGVPWWRVVHSDGTFLAGHEREAVRHYRSEGTPMRLDPDGHPSKLNMRQARWSGPDANGRNTA